MFLCNLKLCQVMRAVGSRHPRSYRTMEGFGIHTFRLINARGKFVRFHWKPLAGKASLVWDEAQKLTGRNPDFHRRELWEAIEAGDFPEYELGFQLIPEEDEFKFDFNLLDPTKLIPEELVPVQRVGKMVLNRDPDNFFCRKRTSSIPSRSYCSWSGLHQRSAVAGTFVLLYRYADQSSWWAEFP